MAKYLINQEEANALRKVVANSGVFDVLAFDAKKKIIANFPFRFKTLEKMAASTDSTSCRANADIYFLGGSTALLVDTDYVVDDSSAFRSFPINTIGTCIASSRYHIVSIESAITYMGLAIASYAADSTNVTIDTLEAMDGIPTTLTELTAKNKFHWVVTENKNCCIKWNSHTSGYDLIQTECP
jgi:hypothetical protein